MNLSPYCEPAVAGAPKRIQYLSAIAQLYAVSPNLGNDISILPWQESKSIFLSIQVNERNREDLIQEVLEFIETRLH